MLARWELLDYVARRYGKLEDVFDLDAQKLQLARQGRIDINSLEQNRERFASRIASLIQVRLTVTSR